MPDDLPQLRRRHQALAARLGQVGFSLLTITKFPSQGPAAIR